MGKLRQILDATKKPKTPWGMFWIIIIAVLIFSMFIASRDTGNFYRSLPDEQKSLISPVGKFVGEFTSFVWAADHLFKFLPPYSLISKVAFHFAVGFVAFFLFAVTINLILGVAPFLPSIAEKSPSAAPFNEQDYYLRKYKLFFESLKDFRVILWVGVGIGIASVFGITLPVALISWILSKVAVMLVVNIVLIVVLIEFVLASLEVKTFRAFLWRIFISAGIFTLFLFINNWFVKQSAVFGHWWYTVLNSIADYFVQVGIFFIILLIFSLIPLVLIYLLMLLIKVLEVRKDIAEATGAGKKLEERRKFKEAIITAVDVAVGVSERAGKITKS